MLIVLFNPLIGPYQVLPFRARVDLEVMVVKECSAFPKAPASLEPHHQIVKCHTQDTPWGVLPLCREAVGVFYSPSRLGKTCYPLSWYELFPLDAHSQNKDNI